MSHRYILRREWLGGGGRVNWVMLNPSTADDEVDDPTIRKCIGFSKRWGFRSMVVTNLFAYRATDPKDLHSLLAFSPNWPLAVGEDNDRIINNAVRESGIVVAAWGGNAAKAQVKRRVDEVLPILESHIYCIGLTKMGHPLHPCMAGYTDQPVEFKRLTA